MSGEASFTTTEEDLVAANRLHARQLWNRRAILRGWILATVALTLILYSFCGKVDWMILSASVAAAVFMAVGATLANLTFAIAARRQHRQAKAFWIPTKIAWDNKCIRFTSDRGHVEHRWAEYFAWAGDNRSILLYLSANSFITIPTKNLAESERTGIGSALKDAGIIERSRR
jgi:hypothetical protein